MMAQRQEGKASAKDNLMSKQLGEFKPDPLTDAEHGQMMAWFTWG